MMGGDALRRRGRGFTLTEMLVVSSVLAALAALLFPAALQARARARQATCLSNLRQLITAHHLYLQDYDEVLPPWFLPVRGRLVTWPVFFRSYYRDPGILWQGFVPPVEMIQPPCLADYALLTWGPTGDGSVYDPHSRWPGSEWRTGEPPEPMRFAEVRRPAETAQFADGFTCVEETAIDSQHPNHALQVAFVDGHVQRVSHRAWWQVDHDARGFFYHLGAADR